jgi:hypothetical protein
MLIAMSLWLLQLANVSKQERAAVKRSHRQLFPSWPLK